MEIIIYKSSENFPHFLNLSQIYKTFAYEYPPSKNQTVDFSLVRPPGHGKIHNWKYDLFHIPKKNHFSEEKAGDQ